MQQAQENIPELLRQRHRLQSDQDDDFSIRNLTEVLQAQEATSRVMILLLAAVAGIGMNMMLVSATQRTREIGLRMAVGARGRDILAQFLIEAVSLVAGGWGHLGGGVADWLAGVADGRFCRRGGGVLRVLSGAACRLAVADPGVALRVG